MRQFDNRNSYFDNNGDVLIGRAIFCDISGIPSVIRDISGNVIDSIVYTTNSGRLSTQVFLENRDYLVKFEKYVGETSMNDDTEDDVWEPQFEVKNVYDTMNVDVSLVGGIQCVDTINSLKQLNPSSIDEGNFGNIVSLLGYYIIGDKPSVNYQWVSDSVEDDNGGSVIKVSGVANGRWILVPSFDYVDTRHFGAFPRSYVGADMAQRLAIQNAQSYASRIGEDIFFYADSDNCYYDISGINLDSVDCSRKARMYCLDNTSSSIHNTRMVYIYSSEGYTGNVYLYGSELKTSFDTKNLGNVYLYPTDRIVLDTNYKTTDTWKDIDVVVDVNQTKGGRFENCQFIGGGTFGGVQQDYRFKNCYIKESLFSVSNYSTPTYVDCDSTVIDWSNADKYIEFCNSCGKKMIDLDWQTANDDHVINQDCHIRHAYINGVLEFEGNLRIDGGCVISKLRVGNKVCENLSIYDSNVTFNEISTNGSKVRNLVISGSDVKAYKLKFTNGRIVDSNVKGLIEICPTSGSIVSSYICRNTLTCNTSPTIVNTTIDGYSIELASIYVNGLYIENNSYVGDNIKSIGFTQDYMRKDQGIYNISDNTGTSSISNGSDIYVTGVIYMSDVIYEVNNEKTYVYVGRKGDNYPYNCYADIIGIMNPFFIFGEDSNQSKFLYTYELELSGIQYYKNDKSDVKIGNPITLKVSGRIDSSVRSFDIKGMSRDNWRGVIDQFGNETSANDGFKHDGYRGDREVDSKVSMTMRMVIRPNLRNNYNDML